jgi:hypothetical protein
MCKISPKCENIKNKKGIICQNIPIYVILKSPYLHTLFLFIYYYYLFWRTNWTNPVLKENHCFYLFINHQPALLFLYKFCLILSMYGINFFYPCHLWLLLLMEHNNTVPMQMGQLGDIWGKRPKGQKGEEKSSSYTYLSGATPPLPHAAELTQLLTIVYISPIRQVGCHSKKSTSYLNDKKVVS